MIKTLAILVLVLVFSTAVVICLDPEPEVTQATPPAENARGYLRPVREGNCWRQYIGQGDRDSILVCG